MNKYKEAYNELFKMYEEVDFEGSMWFRHNLDIIKELVDKEKVANDEPVNIEDNTIGKGEN